MGYDSMITCIVLEFSVQCTETENQNQLIQKLYIPYISILLYIYIYKIYNYIINIFYKHI